jgi:hypothetical protein
VPRSILIFPFESFVTQGTTVILRSLQHDALFLTPSTEILGRGLASTGCFKCPDRKPKSPYFKHDRVLITVVKKCMQNTEAGRRNSQSFPRPLVCIGGRDPDTKILVNSSTLYKSLRPDWQIYFRNRYCGAHLLHYSFVVFIWRHLVCKALVY